MAVLRHVTPLDVVRTGKSVTNANSNTARGKRELRKHLCRCELTIGPLDSDFAPQTVATSSVRIHNSPI
jgi:hypothetical protein